MKKSIVVLLVILSGVLVNYAWAKKEGKLEGLQNPGFVEQPEWFKQSFMDLREDIAEAADEGRRVIFYFYQDGCPYCKKLLTLNFAQKSIVDKTRQNFDVVAVNMWGDKEVTDYQGNVLKEKDFAEQLRVMFTPTLIFFNEKGQKALRINGYLPPEKFTVALDYVSQKMENKMRFSEYLKEVNPTPTHGKLHNKPYFREPPFDLSKVKGDKDYLLVLFEQKECPACDELHSDVLLRSDTKEQIKNFDVVQLDLWSKEKVVTPGGKEMPIIDWAREIDVKYAPTFVFFDQQGKEVIRMEAYLKSFHIQSVMDYVASNAYKEEPSFQRYIDERAQELRDQGETVELMR